jgi:hypothetical protein
MNSGKLTKTTLEINLFKVTKMVLYLVAYKLGIVMSLV